MADGSVKPYEIPGPGKLEIWQGCWAAFRTACRMEDVVHPAALDIYTYKFVERCSKFPTVWFICAQADIACRLAFMVETYRTQVGFEHTQPGSTHVGWKKPWNSIFRMLAEDERFWCEELKDKGIAWQVGPTLVQHVVARPPTGPQRQDNQRSRKRDAPRSNSGPSSGPHPTIYTSSHTGQKLCRGWNRPAPGCSQPCPRGFAHFCMGCLLPTTAASSAPATKDHLPFPSFRPREKG